MLDYLDALVNGTLPAEIELYYTLEYDFKRELSQYGSATGSVQHMLMNTTADREFAE